MHAIRIAKIALVAAFALHASLIVFGNITDYGTNLEFVRHVLAMDTIFPSSTIRYRAITDPALQQAAYLLIIAIETAIAVLCWLGAYRLLRVIRAEGSAFNRAKTMSVSGLTLGILLWQLGFVTIAGEWFGMWMSHRWDAVPDAFHFVVILYASLIFLVMRDDDLPPETNSSPP
jgi:predicted small integral membrane protein